MNDLTNIRYIGVDIAKEKFDVCLYDGNFSSCVYKTCLNNLDGFLELFSFLKSITYLKDIRLGMEATSTYMVNLQKFLDSHEINDLIKKTSA